jgi:NhaP-type Na+/H+ or K+/H+ antiporter
MSEGAVVALAAVLLAWAVVSAALERLNITGPMAFLAAGLVVGNAEWGLVTVDVDSALVHTTAEVTLALVLFVDASGVRLTAAGHDLPITLRLLAVGLPLSIACGLAVGAVFFDSLPIALVGVIAAGLAPTDAALSASIIGDQRLPRGVRRVLNVESGLNDGIATPVVTFCIASAAGVLGIASHDHESGWGALLDFALGVATGIAVGACGASLLVVAHAHGWMAHSARRLAALALALLSFLVASQVGGNPFVSAFVGGLAFGAVARGVRAQAVELAQLGGEVLSLVLWFVFGAVFVLPAFDDADIEVFAYALCSLTVVRMVPVAIALAGSGASRATVAFVGWFGPRGLASIVFALLASEELGEGDPRVDAAVQAIVVTVVLSVVAHGITARPLATRYVRALDVDGRPLSAIERVGGR